MKQILFMVLIGTFIGYITNALAILLLFRPYEKWGPFQGLIPRRKADLARSIAQIVESELINLEELLQDVVEQMDLPLLKGKVEERIMGILKEELPAIVPFFLIEGLIHSYLARQGDDVLKGLIQELLASEQDLGRIRRMVEERIMAFELARMEELIWEISRTELRFIIYLGGILGGVIGLVQGIALCFWL